MKLSVATLYGNLIFALAAPALAGNVDQKLLDVLLQNGSINQQQHQALSADLKKEEKATKRELKTFAKEADMVQMNQFAGWAKSTMFTGDVRIRHEQINIQAEDDYTGRDKNRQRIRARLGATTLVNPEVTTTIQIASGGSADRRSTNQDIDGYFDKKSLWLDMASIDYHPLSVPGLQLFGGKMKQPFTSVGDVMWDSDINPEGVASLYKLKNGTTTYIVNGGYFMLKDNVDGDGYGISEDLAVYTAQASVAFDATDSTRLTIGASLNAFNNEPSNLSTLAGNGNTTNKFELVELFGQVDVIGLPLPLSIYGQYVQNQNAQDYYLRSTKKWYYDGDEDTAYLVGLRTNIGGVAIDYNYRDVERNAVVGTLTDSDFGAGYTTGKGHKIKASYDILKNFNVAATYFMNESDVASRKMLGADVDILQMDLSAKF